MNKNVKKEKGASPAEAYSTTPAHRVANRIFYHPAVEDGLCSEILHKALSVLQTLALPMGHPPSASPDQPKDLTGFGREELRQA